MNEYTLIRSRRKTLSLEITRQMTVLVRAPLFCSSAEIEAFVNRHERWITDRLELQRQRLLAHPEPTEEQRRALMVKAEQELPVKVAHYAALMGVNPTGITITGAKTRFGSCSAKNRLSFSWRLMEYPEAAIDGVVVHELAHIIHKNHSKEFYALVESILPDYKQRRKLLER